MAATFALSSRRVRLWILPEEAQALADGKFPTSLKRRMARWHLIDNRNFHRNADECVKKFDISS
jgi:hypothetical protein